MPQGISIHCFDIARGVVAEGLRVAVFSLEPNERLICEGRAGPDALVARPALGAQYEPGPFAIAFHVADYGYRFNVDNADTHYHFPFKMTPWGYSLFVTTNG
jgi:5-hydroxyisourate hydrolase